MIGINTIYTNILHDSEVHAGTSAGESDGSTIAKIAEDGMSVYFNKLMTAQDGHNPGHESNLNRSKKAFITNKNINQIPKT